MDWEKILTFFTKKEVIIGLVAALIIVIILLFIRKGRIKGFRKQLEAFEVQYNSIKSIPLTFKLNKAVALARVDKNLTETVNNYKDDFDLIHTNLKQITQMLTEMEDNILSGDLKAVKLNVIDLEGMLERGEKDVHKLDQALDITLQQETQQRDEINHYKEIFREIKNTVNLKQAQYAFSMDAINTLAGEIENQFTNFEELMYASEFQKAKDVISELDRLLQELNRIIEALPELLTLARGIIPKQIDNVSEAYSYCKQKGLYLQHLDVLKNVDVITETLKQDLALLRKGEVDNVETNLRDYQTRLEQLLNQIEREDKAYDDLQHLKTETFSKLAEGEDLLKQIGQIYEKVSVRYGYENIDKDLQEFNAKFTDFNDMRERLDKLIKEYTIPASTIIISLKEFNQEVSACFDQLKELKTGLDVVRTDEERAKKQLLKLHLIMNEIQVKIRKNRLPAISNDYEGDVKKAYDYIRTLEGLLEEAPLNTALLSSTLSEAIDYIYLLYNNVNNIVGMALMVEDTIVFGNKYRSTYPDIDSELTRAELCFRNGEYTQALTIAINAIEKMNLDSYEKLIKENASSAS
ncbi:MAG: septation ring formation regulator EzrA [Erysipelotrichaceae bacterium]|nr:septation ring formation regulator EzrA [Erysipelotrichaceae bacterium]